MAFNIGFYAYAIIGHTWADQLLPQLLMEQFDTFPIQCRHIEHMHEGVWFRKNNFYQNDSCENLDNYTPPQTLFVGGILFSRCPSVRLSVRPSVRPCVRPSVTLCFLNILMNHCWIFIKPCKHVHICKTNFLDKKVRARGLFYQSYFPL